MARKPGTPHDGDPKQPEPQPEQLPEPQPEPDAPTTPDPSPPVAEPPQGVVPAPNPTPNLPKPDMVGKRPPGEKLLLANILRDEPRVTMMVPAKTTLTLDDHTQVVIPPGPQAIPKSLVDHWFIKNCGIKPI